MVPERVGRVSGSPHPFFSGNSFPGGSETVPAEGSEISGRLSPGKSTPSMQTHSVCRATALVSFLMLTAIPLYGERFQLEELEGEISLPAVVARDKGFLWRPTLANLGGGELVMAINVQSDIYQPFNVMHLTRSTDGGHGWGRRWPVAQAGWVAGWHRKGLEPGAIFLVYDRIPGGWKGVPRDSPEWNEIYAVRVKVSRAARVESEETR